MPPRLPNLFTSDARRALVLYQLFLARLESNGRLDQVVEMCRRIRRLAPASFDRRSLSVFYAMEVHALMELGDYGAAWRQLRRSERLRWGRSLDLRCRRWRLSDTPLLFHEYVPLLYFRGQYEFGRHLLESGIGLLLRRGNSYDALLWVVDGHEPSHFGVKLEHFYAALGRDLRMWQQWDRLVTALHPRLFEIARISRDTLRQDPAMLLPFWIRLRAEKNRWATVVDRGERDLIESPAAVRKAQAHEARSIAAFSKRIAPRVASSDEEIDRLFDAILHGPVRGEGDRRSP
jgi:hypothetical protein